MIIEIKDLPEGSKIKSIHVDVTFEDGKIQHSEEKVVPMDIDLATSTIGKYPLESSSIQQEREHKEIPPEMTDLTF